MYGSNSVSLVLFNKFNVRIDIGCTWVYGTGNAMTFPQALYLGMTNMSPWSGQTIIDLVESYGDRNSTRMNPFHRLDIGLNFHKQQRRYSQTFSVGAYNVYNRKNPYFVYFDYDGEGSLVEGGLDPKAYQVSLFPMIPSITWNFNF